MYEVIVYADNGGKMRGHKANGFYDSKDMVVVVIETLLRDPEVGGFKVVKP